jgi:uncharacterized protein YcaQ
MQTFHLLVANTLVARKSSSLLVHAIHQDVPFTRAMTTAVDAEVDALASWLGLGSVDRQDRRE